MALVFMMVCAISVAMASTTDKSPATSQSSVKSQSTDALTLLFNHRPAQYLDTGPHMVAGSTAPMHVLYTRSAPVLSEVTGYETDIGPAFSEAGRGYEIDSLMAKIGSDMYARELTGLVNGVYITCQHQLTLGSGCRALGLIGVSQTGDCSVLKCPVLTSAIDESTLKIAREGYPPTEVAYVLKYPVFCNANGINGHTDSAMITIILPKQTGYSV